MSILSATDLCFTIGDQSILDNASLSLESGERVCLIGRNGAGKTSLLRMLASELPPDSGAIRRRNGLKVSHLSQELPDSAPSGIDDTVFDHVCSGLANTQALVRKYQDLTKNKLDDKGLAELEELQHEIDAADGWDIEGRVLSLLREMRLPAHKEMAALSGGWKRRVALARALVSKPDLLLLDEPTNHLDLDTISWLEERALAFDGAILFITHDRAFLSSLATRILDLDRGRLTSWPGDYDNFVRRKQAALEAESNAFELFDKKLAEEERWIRQGIKARRTRNEGRVRALEKMRREFTSRTHTDKTAKMEIAGAGSSGKRVIELAGVSHGFDGRMLFDDVSLALLRGDRLGLIGNNGVGKTTLLNIMLGNLAPNRGSVVHGTRLEVTYFDQLKQELDPKQTVAEVVGRGGEFVEINGSRRHIIGYLGDFLFTPKRAQTQIGVLSGGERHRVALARLFTKPSNLLVLDEPTNDLDLETLEMLESRVAEYAGTLVLVSHDRAFVDNVVTSCLVFEEDGSLVRHAGGFSDWHRLGRRLALDEESIERIPDPPSAGVSTSMPASEEASSPQQSKKKLSYKLKRELETLAGRIEMAETEVRALQTRVEAPDFYRQPYADVQPVLERLEAAKLQLDALTTRWIELEDMNGG